jgi:protein-S-isoprenylcysteine O-methyltransferase Ste14
MTLYFYLATVVDLVVAVACLWSLKSDLESEAAQWSLRTGLLAWVIFVLHTGLCVWASRVDPFALNICGPVTATFLGGGLVGGGTVFFFGGVATFASLERMSGRDRSELVTDGFYLFSRNPQLLGWLFQLLGIAVAGQSVLGLLYGLAGWGFVHAYIVYLEEPFLIKVFGEEYLKYCEDTSRYLGSERNEK